MLAITLALGACIGWGTSDFLGGLKSRRAPLLLVLLISQATALVALSIIVVSRGTSPPDGAAIVFAAIAGLSEAVGVAALYQGLAVGMMSIVAPVAAIAPVLPVMIGLAMGEVPGPVQGIGLALAIAGVVIASSRRAPAATTIARSVLTGSVVYGLLAAAGFGTFFFAMDRASEGDVPWALLVARLTAVTMIAVVAFARRPRFAVGKADLPTIAVIGLLIVAADSMYATASTLGLLGIVAVLSSLHPVVTMGLARVVLHEHLARLQQIGIATSLCGAVLIAWA